MTPKSFRPTCYSVQPFQPAPACAHRGTIQLVAAALVLLALIVAVIQPMPAIRLVLTGDFPGASQFYHLQEDDTLVTALLDLHRAIGYGGPRTANAGIAFGPEALYIGYEAVGQPGFFICRYDTCHPLP